jgi:hypothetical protein
MGKFYIESSAGNVSQQVTVVEKPTEVIVEKIVINEVVVEKPVEVIKEVIVEKPIEVIVEKIVYLPVKCVEQVEKLRVVHKEIPVLIEVPVLDLTPYLEERARAEKFEKQSKRLKLALAITIIVVSLLGVLI